MCTTSNRTQNFQSRGINRWWLRARGRLPCLPTLWPDLILQSQNPTPSFSHYGIHTQFYTWRWMILEVGVESSPILQRCQHILIFTSRYGTTQAPKVISSSVVDHLYWVRTCHIYEVQFQSLDSAALALFLETTGTVSSCTSMLLWTFGFHGTLGSFLPSPHRIRMSYEKRGFGLGSWLEIKSL